MIYHLPMHNRSSIMVSSKSLTYSGIAYERTSQITISIDHLPENEIRCTQHIRNVAPTSNFIFGEQEYFLTKVYRRGAWGQIFHAF